jgi:hypothetical protein
MDFYDERVQIGLTAQQKSDLGLRGGTDEVVRAQRRRFKMSWALDRQV